MFDDFLSGCPEWSISDQQCRQCCHHKYKAKTWKQISCPQSVHSGKSCLSGLGTKMGLKYADPDMKAPVITDHVNQNLRTLLSPHLWWLPLFWRVFIWVGAYVCVCRCASMYMHMYVFRDQNVVPHAPFIFFLDTGSLTGLELPNHIWLASESTSG